MRGSSQTPRKNPAEGFGSEVVRMAKTKPNVTLKIASVPNT